MRVEVVRDRLSAHAINTAYPQMYTVKGAHHFTLTIQVGFISELAFQHRISTGWVWSNIPPQRFNLLANQSVRSCIRRVLNHIGNGFNITG